MARRTYYDPLQTICDDCWLVVRDMVGTTLEHRKLPGGTDLRADINRVQEQWIGNGWMVQPMGRHCAGFFCTKDGQRLYVGIQRLDPTTPAPPTHGSFLSGQQ